MRRFVSAIALCLSLLAGMSYWMYRAEAAKEDAIITLLNLPAPPAPNPLVKVPSGTRPTEFYDRERPPPDNAPIEDLMEYWSRMSTIYQDLAYNPKPSATVASRLFREFASDPERIVDFLNIFQDDRRAAEIVRAQFQKLEASGEDDESGELDVLRRWLRTNTSEFSGELENVASRIRDVNGYVDNHEELLSLTKVDWDRAEPIVQKLYNDKSQKVSQVLAAWAMYRRALESGGSDVDKYRDELKAVVENKAASAGMRDMALDALIKEAEWPGRDDWYIGLLKDETLAELRVRGSVYTGLTTIMYHVGDDRLTERMIGLMSSDNIHVRTAAAKNLLIRLTRLSEGSRNDALRKQIVESMLPWLSNKNWLKADSSQRSALVSALQSVKMPEAVPALIAALDEKESMSSSPYANAANAAANAINAAANAMNVASTVSNRAANAVYRPANANAVANVVYSDREFHPLRSSAIVALGNQGDARAAAPLRRVLVESEEWERAVVVKALLDCGGFTTAEQVAALEFMARSAGDIADLSPESEDYAYGGSAKDRARYAARVAIAEQRTTVVPQTESEQDSVDSEFDNYAPPQPVVVDEEPHPERYYTDDEKGKALTEDDLKYLVAAQLVAIDDPDDMLVRTTVDRVSALDPREPIVASTLRRIILGWNGMAVNSLILGDIKNGRTDADAILKMLAIRKKLRETQMADVTDMRGGVPAANAIAACLLEDRGQSEAILTNGPDAAKIALFACTRLIRAPLQVGKAVELMSSPNKTLAVAAERYLEAKDSPEARAAILRRYPNQAKILGATTTYNVSGVQSMPGIFLRDVFNTVNPYFGTEEYAYLTFMDERDPEIEKRLQKEVSSNPDLLGVYAYDRQFVRIYKDQAVFSWEDDPARFRERTLELQQFESLKTYLANSRVDAMPPFLACSMDCASKQLLMIGKAGGRRVFVKGDRKMPAFFANLQGFFDEMKKQPAKLKYYPAEQIPGMEVLFEDERYAAVSVWKKGGDLRVLATDGPREKAIIREVDLENERAVGELQAEGKDTSDTYSKYYRIKEARRFEASGWFGIANGRVGEPVSQPAGAEYIPATDILVPAPTFGSWAAKMPAFEIRADEAGLYKITNGRSVRLRAGHYTSPVVTSNGRWVIATKYDAESGSSKVVRVNLANNRELPVGGDELPLNMALSYLPTRNLVVLSSYDEEEDHHHEGEYDENFHPSAYDNGRGYYLLNPDTGAVVPAAGEVRPLAQQSFRSLQPTSTPGEFWAAIPRGKAGTLFGIYSTRTFSFKPILKLPKILFDSMEMWVDETERKVYFIHQGHLLAAPYTAPAAR